MKKPFIVFSLISVALLSSCILPGRTVREAENGAQALRALADARDDFMERILKKFRSDAGEPGKGESDALDITATVQALAMEAASGAGPDRLIGYLKEKGLWDTYLKVVRTFDVEKNSALLSARSPGSRALTNDFIERTKNGTVFVWYGSDRFSEWFIYGTWKHSAVRNDRKKDEGMYFINAGSASGASSSGGGVNGVWWQNAYFETNYECMALYPRNATEEQGRKAAEYAEQFLGRPYDIWADRMSDGAWYCTKVAYRAWLSQGIDIEHPGTYDANPFLPGCQPSVQVLAQSFVDDADMVRVGE